MDSESVSTWKRTLEIQGFGRSAEHVPSAVASRSTGEDQCKDGCKMPGKSNDGKRKIMKEIIIIQMVVTVTVARAIIAKEDAEEAAVVAAEEETTIVSI
jgi:hypothetical protein